MPRLTHPIVTAALLALACAHTAALARPAERPAAKPATPEPVASADPCAEWVPRLPNVTAQLCTGAELKPTVGKSVKGRTIFARDVSAAVPQLRVLVVGAMHGDELSSASMRCRMGGPGRLRALRSARTALCRGVGLVCCASRRNTRRS